jgi:hypothetical protein
MSKVSLKVFLIIEVLLLISIGLFSLDLLPRNYNEFQGICSRTWPKDEGQYHICMEPYFRQTNLDRYVIGVGVGALVLTPVFYIFKKKQY